MRITPNGSLTLIPVEIYGVPVGSARITHDGAIEIVMGTPCALGKEFKRKIEKGLAGGLSIGLIENGKTEL